MKFKYKIIAIPLIFILSVNANSSCNKEDINYYLEKGFTTEQITALCGDNTSSIKEENYKSYSEEYADLEDEEYKRRMRIERQVFFKSSLGAQNISIRKDILRFHQYECAREGMAKPGSAFNVKGCAVVQTVVKLSEVEVSEKEFKEKVIFGNRFILVEGNVTTKLVGGFEGLSEYDAKVLSSKVLGRLNKNKGRALVPVKKGLNFEYAINTFKEIVAFHKNIANEKKGVRLGGDLTFEGSDEPQEYIIEEEDKDVKFSNDNDEDIVDGTLVFDDLDSFENSSGGGNSQIPDDVFN